MMGQKNETKYKANADGTRIINIPFERYIKEISKPENIVVPNIDMDFTGEKNSQIINDAVKNLKDDSVIYIPQGEYKISTIILKSNTTLFVSKGARLVSLNCDENLKSENPIKDAVVLAENSQNITITGGGVICGCGESYTLPPEKYDPLYPLEKFNLYDRVIESRRRIHFAKNVKRNNIIRFNSCQNVMIKNIVLEEAAEWTCVINTCDDVKIENMVIDNHMHVANTDGIDICGSSNVSISNCFIATGDDAIVLKSPNDEIKNVTVENCVLLSFANCFKIGTETQYDVNNIKVNNCQFFLPNGIVGGYSGIAIESADGANVSDVIIDNIDMNGISAPVLVWLGCRFKYDKKSVGSINNILISNVNAIDTELPSAVTGCKYNDVIYNVENVVLKNINSYYRDTKENLSVRDNVSDFSMCDYPEITRISHKYFKSHELSEYWDLPCYSLFMRNVDNIDYKAYKTTPRSCNNLDELYIEFVNE